MEALVIKYKIRSVLFCSMCMLLVHAGFAFQEKKDCALSGFVLNDQGVALDRAIIRIEGGSNQLADSSGAFCFTYVKNGTYIIHVSHVGYKAYTGEVKIVGGTTCFFIGMSGE